MTKILNYYEGGVVKTQEKEECRTTKHTLAVIMYKYTTPRSSTTILGGNDVNKQTIQKKVVLHRTNYFLDSIMRYSLEIGLFKTELPVFRVTDRIEPDRSRKVSMTRLNADFERGRVLSTKRTMSFGFKFCCLCSHF